MAWLTRTTWVNGDPVSHTDLNNVGLDIRTWGANVDAGGHSLVNVASISYVSGTPGPLQFSHFAGTLTGARDGSNAVFTIATACAVSDVILNGATLIPGQHYTFTTTTVTFLDPYIPQPGADILIRGWL